MVQVLMHLDQLRHTSQEDTEAGEPPVSTKTKWIAGPSSKETPVVSVQSDGSSLPRQKLVYWNQWQPAGDNHGPECFHVLIGTINEKLALKSRLVGFKANRVGCQG